MESKLYKRRKLSLIDTVSMNALFRLFIERKPIYCCGKSSKRCKKKFKLLENGTFKIGCALQNYISILVFREGIEGRKVFY